MTTKLGMEAEAKAEQFLVKKGYKIVAKNVRFAFGEIDLVAQIKSVLVFVEVKFRTSLQFGAPYEAVGRAKQHRIIRAAQAFMQRLAKEPTCRFDVISITPKIDGYEFEHLEDAFWVEDS